MLKQPIRITPTFKLSESYQAPKRPHGSGKSYFLTSTLLNDLHNNLEVSGYRKVYLSRTKVGSRRIHTISNI